MKTVTYVQPEAQIIINHPDGGTENRREPVGKPVKQDDQLCNVGVSAGFTEPDKKVSYANTKVSVSLFVPCPHEEIEETYEFVKDWVGEKIQEFYDEL